ncbi:hypothetical protein PSHT_06691 [Puccinia striiformis]|uniref:Uncharacterized protein n=1 Tax=Puccinia striiformis TaxID=27350 RepID=A0A2S4W4P5_9BASI|nr:hypothetical protein PSHT_06691 [Puccinia striiformis]
MHYSPQIALLEAITCALMLLFYFWHSWHYDRLKSMFRLKRVKSSQEGLDPTNSFHLVMRAFPFPTHRGRPITLNSLGWSGEGIVHLEELAFWFFLIHLKDTSPPWFKSAFFRAFVILSIVSSGALICIVGASKPNVMLTQAILMTVATSFNTSVTCGFFWVFSKFPRWLKDLKQRGAPSELIIRLHGFGTLNQIRMIFRLIFTLPLLALSMDGLMAQPVLNKRVWVIDLIVMTSTVAFAAQGIMTLLIFLPRNLSKECGFSQDEHAGQEKTSDQPLLHCGLDSGCVSRLSTDPPKQPRPPSPTTSTYSLGEKRQSYGSDMSPVNYTTAEATTNSYSLGDINICGNLEVNSNLNNETSFQTRSTLTKHGRDYNRSSFATPGSIQICSPGTSQMSMENSHVSRKFVSPSTTRSPNFPPSTNEFSSSLAQGNSVPFALTHFPRYFAPSERRAFESCDGGSSRSFRTMSRAFSLNQTLPIPSAASQQTAQLHPIHPAIRYFKSPIDIASTWFPEEENIS